MNLAPKEKLEDGYSSHARDGNESSYAGEGEMESLGGDKTDGVIYGRAEARNQPEADKKKGEGNWERAR